MKLKKKLAWVVIGLALTAALSWVIFMLVFSDYSILPLCILGVALVALLLSWAISEVI